MARSDDDPVKPSDLSEAEREALKRQYRGVFWDRKTKRWRCQLGYQSKKIFLGYFDDAGEAARAYDQKLVELRGAGARTNFPITEYLDMMPTPSKRAGVGGAAAAAAAAPVVAARPADNLRMQEDEEEDDGEEIEQPAPSGRHAAAAAGYGAETPHLDPGYGAAAGGMVNQGQVVSGLVGSRSPQHCLSHLPSILPLSTELPTDQQQAVLAAQDYEMAGEDDLTAAAQLAIELRRSFDGSSYKWHQQLTYSSTVQQHQPPATATSTGSAGGSAGAAAAAAGYAARCADYDLAPQQRQQQHPATYGDDTAAAAAAGYGGGSLYGGYGSSHHHVHAHPHHPQQHYGQHHLHLRNGCSASGDLYGSGHAWPDQASAGPAAGAYDGHPAGYGSHSGGPYLHHAPSHQHHHSHPGMLGGHGAFSDSGGAYGGAAAHASSFGVHPHHQLQHQQHSHAAAAAAAAGYGHHAHHLHYQQHQARHFHHHHHMYHQQQQQQAGAGAAGYYPADAEEQPLAAAASGQLPPSHMQHYHAHAHAHHQQQHQQQQQQHVHYPLHHSHSYPGAAGGEAGMEGAAATAAAGYYGAPGGSLYAGSQHQHGHPPLHRPTHNGQYVGAGHPLAVMQQQQQQYGADGREQMPLHGMYNSSSEDLQKQYGGGLAAQQQQQYDACTTAAADYRQRLATYGLHSYAADGQEYAAAALETDVHRSYSHPGHLQRYQQERSVAEADAAAGAMETACQDGIEDRSRGQEALYNTEEPWLAAQQAAAAGYRANVAAGDAAAAADGLNVVHVPAVRTTRTSGRTSRATSRAAAAAESDEYDAEDDDDYGSDSDTGRGRGRNSKRRSRAAAGGSQGGEGALRTKQRTGDGGEEERGHSYRGVFWDKKSRRWRCQLGHKNKKIFLGYFGVAEDAARAYDQKLVELHGGSAKTNFPIQDYLGGRRSGDGAAVESPRAPCGPLSTADVPARRRSSHAGDASAKGSQAQHSEFSWGALSLPRSARHPHDAGCSEGAPRLSWAGVDTFSPWDQHDSELQFAKRRKLMEGGSQLPTSPQEFGFLTAAMHASHQAVGSDDNLMPGSATAAAAMARQSSGYRVVETPSVLTAGLTGRHSSSGQANSLPSPAPSFDAAAVAAGILQPQQQQQQPGAAAGNSLALARLASGEVGAVQALSGLQALDGRVGSGPQQDVMGCGVGSAVPAAVAGGSFERAGSGVPQPLRMAPSSAANAVLAAAGGNLGASSALLRHGSGSCLLQGSAAAPQQQHQQQQQQQSQASRLFDEAVSQYGARSSAPGLPQGPSAVSAIAVAARTSDPNTGTSSTTATTPASAGAATGQFPASSNVSPHIAAANTSAHAALSRLNSIEMRAVQALSGIHSDVGSFKQSSAAAVGTPGLAANGSGSWGGYAQQQQQQQQQQQMPLPPAAAGQGPTPASITETVAKELLCKAPVVSAVASSSIAAVAAAAAAAAAAKSSAASDAAAATSGGARAARVSTDGSFSGLVGEGPSAGAEGRLPAGTPLDTLQPDRLSTPALSPLLASNLLLPPPPPLQLQLDGHDLGDSLPASASAAAAAAVTAAGGGAGGNGRTGVVAGAAAKLLSHLDPGDAFAAEAGWGNALEDLLMPKRRPSCSGNSGLIGLLENIGQFKHEVDAVAAAAAVAAQQQQGAAAAEAAGPSAADSSQQRSRQNDAVGSPPPQPAQGASSAGPLGGADALTPAQQGVLGSGEARMGSASAPVSQSAVVAVATAIKVEPCRTHAAAAEPMAVLP